MNLIIEKMVDESGFDEVIKEAIEASLAEEKVTEECEISVTLCDNEEIAVLNDQYMGRQGPTDVLSFPLLDFKKAKTMTAIICFLVILLFPFRAQRSRQKNSATH